jgi:hypothetical protein
LKVLWGGSVVDDLVDGAIVQNNGTTETQYTVLGLTASSTTTRLMFLGRQDPSFDGLDDVDVELAGTAAPTGAPEPITLSIFGAGLAGAVAMYRRRKLAKV